MFLVVEDIFEEVEVVGANDLDSTEVEDINIEVGMNEAEFRD
jgi:hypothetical protein